MHPLRCGSSSVVPKGNSPTLPGMHLGGPLPIDAALPELTAALGAHNIVVLVAPPGAGKTTRVPLVLAAQAWARDKKVIVLEPAVLSGLNVALIPAGSPDAVRVTLPSKFPLGITKMVLLADFPCATEMPTVEDESVKSLVPALGDGSTS